MWGHGYFLLVFLLNLSLKSLCFSAFWHAEGKAVTGILFRMCAFSLSLLIFLPFILPSLCPFSSPQSGPLIHLWNMEKHHKHSQRDPRNSPGWKRILVYLEPKECVWWLQMPFRFCWRKFDYWIRCVFTFKCYVIIYWNFIWGCFHSSLPRYPAVNSPGWNASHIIQLSLPWLYVGNCLL